MKKMLAGLMVLGFAIAVHTGNADTYTYTLEVDGNSTNTSAVIPVSGYLDKIELFNNASALSTNNVVIATWVGTVKVDTLSTNSLVGQTPQIVRLRVQPTDNTGTVIPSVWSGSGTGGTNASTILSVVYDKVLVGGNMKISTYNLYATPGTNTYVFYYEPLKK